MVRLPHTLQLAAALALTLCAAPAMAQLPPEIAKLIADSRANGDAEELAAVVAAAKRLYPEDANEIDVLAAMEPSKAVEFAGTAPNAPEPTATESAATETAAAKPAEAPPSLWKGKGELSGFLTNGNSEAFGVALIGEVAHGGESVAHKWFTLVDYQEASDKLSREYGRFGYQIDWKINPHQYAYARGEYEHDRTAGVEHRGIAAIGYGWRVATKEPFTLNLEAGPGLRRTVYYTRPQETELVARGVVDLDWAITPNIKLTEDTEVVFADASGTIRSITGLQAKLTGRLSSRISYDVRHSTEPEAGKKATDTTARVGIIYDF